MSVLMCSRAALDVITMQQRPTVCFHRHHRRKMLLKIFKKSVHQSSCPARESVVRTTNQLLCQSLKELHFPSSISLHCKQCTSHSTRWTIDGNLFNMASGSTWRKRFHTAVSSTGTGSQVLFSTRWGKLTSQDDARRRVARLSAEERTHLEKAIEDLKRRSEEADSEPPTRNQLKLLCYQSALPFIGFGFLDNVIMISVGEYIDTTIGVTLGISTMAAAGIGNMISDLAGLGLADQVEALCRRLGIPNPNLSSAQLRHRSSRWMSLIGRCVGIIIGCTVGMAPLLWFDDSRKDSCSDQS